MPAVDWLTLFSATYPSAANLIWVDSAQGNDGNSGTQASPKQTIQGGVNAASAGTRVMVRPGSYGNWTFSGKNGTQSNWIEVVGQAGARVFGSGLSGTGIVNFSNCSFCAVYGLEVIGLNSSGSPHETGFYLDTGHSVAVFNCHIRNMGGHAFAANGGSRFDVMFNRMHHLARWNNYQTSAISCISMPNSGSAWVSDGYHNRVVGNVIDAVWEDASLGVGQPYGITDGNGIILDYSGGYNGRTLVAHNLIVGCGGRGIHDLGVSHVDIWHNTTVDNCWNLDGTELGEISMRDSSDDSHAAWNVCAARPGSDLVSIFYGNSGSTWSDTVYVRGTGGNVTVNQNNNVNKTAVGPAGYFQQYQAGVFAGTSITNIAGFRPTVAQVAVATPPANVRAALVAWPDALGFLRPTSGQWAYGAFEATTDGSPPPPDPDPDPPPPPSSGSLTVEAESGTVFGNATISADQPGYLGTGYIGFFGNTGDANQVSVVTPAAATYRFRVRYGNATTGGVATQARLLINGVQVAILNLPSTSTDWADSTRFEFSELVDVALISGSNTVRLEHTGTEFTYADIDQYIFEPPGGTGPPPAQAPVAAFAFSPSSPGVNQSVSFVDQSTNTPTSWLWNFGTGPTSTAQNPIRSYTVAGTYTVTLTATNAQGSNTTTRQIVVLPVSGTAGSHQHQVTGNPLLNSTSYIVVVEVRDAQGLTASDSEDFATSWTSPTAPAFTVNP